MENELKHLTGLVCHNKSHGCSWHGQYTAYKVDAHLIGHEHLSLFP